MVIDPTNRRIWKTAWYYGVRISLSSQAIKRKDESHKTRQEQIFIHFYFFKLTNGILSLVLKRA
jgi:hypothetical protein